MIKYFCERCGACFRETEADQHDELIDMSQGYSPYYEHYVKCPECEGWEDIVELSLSKECEEYDDEHGCKGQCDECPLNEEEGDGS